MKYCEYCGSAMSDDALFCSHCGAAVKESTQNAAENTAVISPTSQAIQSLTNTVYQDQDTGYRIVLISRGTCALRTAKEVVADLLGYTTTAAGDLIEQVPVEIADEMNERQAMVLAQALAEYGMEVTVLDENNRYINLGGSATESVYQSNGSLTSAALAILATLTATNRVYRQRRYQKRSLLDLIFRPAYTRPKPVHIRRHISPDPQPVRRIFVPKPAAPNPPAGNHRGNSPAPSRPPQGNKPAPSGGRPSSGSQGKPPAGGNKPSGGKPGQSPARGNRPGGGSRSQQGSGNRPAGGSGKAPSGGNKPSGSGGSRPSGGPGRRP